MGGWLWILLLGLGALLLLGLFLYLRRQRDEARLPFGDAPAHDPLDGHTRGTVSHRSEPLIEDISGWTEEGTGPVRRRPLEEAPPARRAPRFVLDTLTREPGEEEHAKPLRPEPRQAQPPAVVPLYLVARQAEGFAGASLAAALARHGFEFGDMDIYHHADAHGVILYSLMNGVPPGTFDPARLPTQHTPALALFLRLPLAEQPNLVFEQFLDMAYRLAEELDGVLLDERREALSSEAIDRMREVALGE